MPEKLVDVAPTFIKVVVLYSSIAAVLNIVRSNDSTYTTGLF